MPTDSITSANTAVAKAIEKSETSRKQKGPYLYLTDAQRCEVGKKAYAIDIMHGLKTRTELFSKKKVDGERLPSCCFEKLKEGY